MIAAKRPGEYFLFLEVEHKNIQYRERGQSSEAWYFCLDDDCKVRSHSAGKASSSTRSGLSVRLQILGAIKGFDYAMDSSTTNHLLIFKGA